MNLSPRCPPHPRPAYATSRKPASRAGRVAGGILSQARDALMVPIDAVASIELRGTARRALGLEPVSMYDDGRDVLAFRMLLCLAVVFVAWAVSQFGLRDVLLEAPKRGLGAAGGVAVAAGAHAVEAAQLLKGGLMHVYYAAVGRRPFSPYGAPPPGGQYGFAGRASPQQQQPFRPGGAGANQGGAAAQAARAKNGQARSSAPPRAAPNGPANAAAAANGPFVTVNSAPTAAPGGGWLPWSAPKPGPRSPTAHLLATSASEKEQLDRAELFHKGRCGSDAPDPNICGRLLGRFTPDDVPQRNPDGTPANVRDAALP